MNSVIDFILGNLWVAWLIIAGIFLFIEIETTALVSLWFVLGAIVSAIVALFCDNFIIQFVFFIVFSIVFLILFKTVYKGKMKPEINNVEYSPIGRIATACSDINNYSGKVKLDDVYWKAVCKEGNIADGEKVKIIDVSGTKLIVELNKN